MPPRATGTVEWRDDHWAVRIPKKDETGKRKRPWYHFPKGLREDQREEAEAVARDMARMVREGRVVEFPKTAIGGELVSKWFDRWQAGRKARGLRSTDDDASIFKNHVAPAIGSIPMAGVTRDHLEDVRDRLDAKVRERIAFERSGAKVEKGRKPGLSAKTAENAWGLVLAMFGDACRSKDRTLRVREDNPTEKVEGPDDHPEKEAAFLYPSEFATFIRCADVPMHWRRLLAISICLGTRSAELRAIRWSDVDFEHGKIAITKQVSRKTGEVTTTKTSAPRRPDLEAALVPLLVATKGEPHEAVAWMPPEEDQAVGLRKWLLRAGVMRHELHHETPTTRPINFHDGTRRTCATWMAARGQSALEIMQRTGHKNLATVQRYVEQFGNANRSTFGEPFPALDVLLAPEVRPPVRSRFRGARSQPAEITHDSLRPQRELNPCYRRERPMS